MSFEEIKAKFMKSIKENDTCEVKSKSKISVIGCGKLGTICAASLIYSDLASDIVIIDDEPNICKAEVELMDLIYCSIYTRDLRLTYSSEISSSANSDICLICLEPDSQQRYGSNPETVTETVKLFEKFIPNLMKYNHDTVLFVLTYPYHPLTHVCWKLAKIPKHRVIGIGTCIGSARFQLKLAQRFNIAPYDCIGWMVGLHEKTDKFPIWSSVRIAGVRLIDMVPDLGTKDDPEQFYLDIDEVETKRTHMLMEDGPPCWAVGSACAKICKAILTNSHEVFPISVNVKGLYGIRKVCFIGMPCIIGQNGVHSIMELQLTQQELIQVRKASKIAIQLAKIVLQKD